MREYLKGDFKPIFLLAVPQMTDPNFAKSVILLIHHDAGGAVGLVINSKIDLNIGNLATEQDIDCHASLSPLPVFQGGPVEPERCWIIHTDKSIEEKQNIAPGLFLSGTDPTLKTLLVEGKTPLRLVLGYAGWDAGQLEQEMVEGSWITADVNAKHIFETEPSKIWEGVLKDLGIEPMMIAEGRGVH